MEHNRPNPAVSTPRLEPQTNATSEQSSVQSVDPNAPYSPSQVLQLQKKLGNKAVLQLMKQRMSVNDKTSTKPEPLQLKLKVKSGETYGSDTINPTDSINLKAAKADAENYLLKSTADVANIESDNYDNIEVLSPHRHLIGETHSASQFLTAVNDWGWGAMRMSEKLSSHPRMGAPAGERTVREDPTAPEYQALPLENTVAKQLGIINLSSWLLEQIKVFSVKDPLSIPEQTQILNVLAPKLKQDLGNLDSIKDALITYKGNSPGAVARRFSNKVAYPGLAEITVLKDIKAKSELFRRVDRRIDRAKTDGEVKFVFMDIAPLELVLNAMKAACAAIIKGEDLAAYTAADVDNQQNQFINHPTRPTDDIREHYMAENIKNNLPVPGMVKVGSGHIAGLTAKAIPNAKLYASYAAFKTASEADNVL